MNTTHFSTLAVKDSNSKQELSRVNSAAVINRCFCSLLLQDPLGAVNAGYDGERFHLDEEQKQRLSQMRAGSLAEFAAQLTAM